MRRLTTWLLALMPVLALAQPVPEKIKLANTMATFTPVPGKYLLMLPQGQQAAAARTKAEKAVQGLKVLSTLPSPAALVVSLPSGAEITTGANARAAVNLGGEAIRPVYMYSDGTEEAPTGTVAVRFKDHNAKKSLVGLAQSIGATYRTAALDATLAYLDLPASANPFEVARSLQSHPGLVWAEPDMVKFLKRQGAKPADVAKMMAAPEAVKAAQITLPNDPMLGSQWYLHNGGRSNSTNYWNNSDVKVFEAWETTMGSNSIKVAILDEGVDLAHPDLAGQLLAGFDATGLGSAGGPSGDDAHGTACAGIVAAKAGNGIGVSGVAPNCKIIPVRIAYSNSSGDWVTSNATIGNALQWAWKTGQADVLSNSWGGGSSSSLITNPIDSAVLKGRAGKGAPVIFAAGNSNSTSSFFPATYSKVISVVAMSMCDTRKTTTSCDGETWWGSNYGPNGDVSAPGVIMQTLDISGSAGYSATDYTGTFNGTSSACPTVAGVMALLLSNNPALTEAQARVLLETSCDKVGTYTYNASVAGQPNGTWSTDLGYGRVNALRALSSSANTLFSNMQVLSCGASYSGGISGAGGYFPSFGCSPNAYPTSEGTYRIYLNKNSSVKLTLTQTAGQVDLFVLKRFHKDSCLASSTKPGNDTISFVAPYNGFYYVVVDGPASSSAYTITAGCTQPPTITDFTPKIVNYGALVTVTGTNFNPLTSLKLNGVTVPGATANGAGTSITFTVPNGATSGLINVLTPGGSANTASNLVVAGQICAVAAPISCGDSVTTTTVGATSIASSYACQTWNESGPERVYSFQGTAGAVFTATLSNMSVDLDVFLLSACHPDSCVASGDASLTATLKNKTYYILVEGYNGASGGFKLKTTCSTLKDCHATSNCSTGDLIDDVTVHTLSNQNTGCAGAGGWIQYPATGSLTTTLNKGQSYPYLVRFGSQFKQKSAIWMDWNNDGDFTDAKECVVLKNVQDSILSGTFTVPTWAVSGQVKMRIRASYTASMDTAGSCTNSTYGETEDYFVTLVVPTFPAIVLTSVSTQACIASDVQFFFNTTDIPQGTSFQLWASTDSTNFIQQLSPFFLRPPSPTFNDSPGSFQTNFPMGDNEDSIKIWIQVRQPGGVVSNILSYWQYNMAHPQGPGIVERCGPGPMSITLTNLTPDVTVDWYALGDYVASGLTLDVANQTTSYSYMAFLTNHWGCGTQFQSAFAVNPQPKINSATPAYAAPGETIRLRGTGLATVNSVLHGSLTASFIADGDTAMNVTVPVGATANRVYVSTEKGCKDSSSVMPITAPAVSWPITFGNTGDDFVRSIVRDGSGNIYASITFTGSISLQGTTINAGTKRDGLLAKFTDAGQLLWYTRIGNNVFNTEPRGVNIDGAGNPYWAGSFAGSVVFPNGGAGVTLTAAGSYDAYVARFNPATGACLWAKRVGGAGNDYLYACFVSNSGNVYAGGSFTGAITFQVGANTVNLPNAGGLDGFIVKYDPSGNGLYASCMGSATDDEVKSIEYNGGDLVACGYIGNNCTFPAGTNAVPSTITLPTLNGSRDGWAARINSEGRAVWVKNFGTIFNDEAQSICMDPSTGNTFVTAQVADAPLSFNSVSYGGFGGNDIAVLGWNFYTQAPVWAKRIGSASGDAPTSLRWDGNRLVVSGTAGGSFGPTTSFPITSNGGQDAVLLRYDKATGAISSGQMVGGTGNDQALALWCNTATRECFVGGGFQNSATFPATGGSVVRASNGQYDGFLFRATPSVGVREGINETTLAAGSLRAYPVPASRELRIALNGQNLTSLAVFDAKGARLSLPTRFEGSEAVVDVTSLRAGIYMVQAAGKVARFVKE